MLYITQNNQILRSQNLPENIIKMLKLTKAKEVSLLQMIPSCVIKNGKILSKEELLKEFTYYNSLVELDQVEQIPKEEMEQFLFCVRGSYRGGEKEKEILVSGVETDIPAQLADEYDHEDMWGYEIPCDAAYGLFELFREFGDIDDLEY